jgi:hypothetical protein
MFPWVAPDTMTLDQLGAFVWTGNASTKVQLGIYAAAANNLPTGSVLANTGDISTATQGPFSGALGANFQVIRGTLYWLATFLHDNACDMATFGNNPGSAMAAAIVGDGTLSNLMGTGTNPTNYVGVQDGGHTYPTWPAFSGGALTKVIGGQFMPIVYIHATSVP